MSLFKSTSIYLLLGFLPIASNFFLAPVYTSYLQPEEYALVGIATLFQTFISFFISLSLDGAYNRLFFKYQDNPAEEKLLLSSLLLTVLATSFVIGVLFFFFGDRLFAALLQNQQFRFSNFGCWVLVTTLANVLFLFFAAHFRNKENVLGFSYASIAFFLVPVAGTLIGLIGMDKGAQGVVAGRAVGSIAVALFYTVFFFRKTGFLFQSKKFREAILYSFPLIPYQIMFAAFSNIDRIILEQKFSAHVFGVYNFAALVSSVVLVFITALYNAINPRIYKSVANGQDSYVKKLNDGSIYISVGFICLCVAFVVPMMRLFISNQYADASQYIGLLFLSYIPYVHYLIYSLPLLYHSKTKVFPIISFFALASGLAFNFFLVPLIGIWSVCLSVFVIRFVQMACCYFYVWKNKYHHLDYIHHKDLVILTSLVMFIYLVFFWLNLRYNLFPVELVNLLPLLLFSPFVIVKNRRYLKDVLAFISLRKNVH
ncbi:oligosaccharide flippase family protein [Flavisolibacter sp. BT320]|nr:oligosaccharide flippase family protein [Flavisolibacter longurius]